jgi:hypothetical protein
MVRKYFFLALLLIPGAVILTSCKKEVLSDKKEILSLIFEASKNSQLDRNYLGEIVGTEVQAQLPFGTDLSILVPTIEVSPRAALSPECGCPTDFTGPVYYTVTAEDGTTKNFTVTVSPAPAPYIGDWSGGPIDFGLGLMRINVHIDETGAIEMSLVDIMTGEKNSNSLKGYFDPISRQDIDIMLNQTQHWTGMEWSDESAARTIMYHVNHPQNLRFYYCICNPRQDWWFQLNLSRQ